jgi:hypothetical protein
MAFYHFFGSSNRTTTSLTMFGVLGPWQELPDGALPILWIDTTSPAGANQGLYMIGYSTSPSLPPTIVRLQVANYEPGTRWFLTNDVGAFTSGGAMGLQGDVQHDVRLYYRSLSEGPDPNRMV